MSIQQDVLEFQNLEAEIKRRRKELRKLCDRKNQCEQNILTYLDENQQPGLKMNGVTIIAHDRRKRKYQSKKEKTSKGEYILEKYGIHDSKDALEEIMEAMRGSPEKKYSLKMY